MEERQEFITLLRNSWPVAYAEYRKQTRQPVIEPLQRHLLITAALSIELFKERLGVIEKRIGWKKGDLVRVMHLSALLHDIAKSSKYYFERFKASEDTKISFWLHELAGAVLLEMARISFAGSAGSGDSLEGMLKMMARSIARHHSAMGDRHPWQMIRRVLSNKNSIKYLEEVLRGIETGVVDSIKGLTPCRYDDLDEDLCDQVFQRLEEAVDNIHRDTMFSGKIHDILRGNNIAKPGSNTGELLVVFTITGFLVIADNIAAHLGRGVSDDETSPAYVRHWICELGEKLESLSFGDCEVLRSVKKDIDGLIMEFSLEGGGCVS